MAVFPVVKGIRLRASKINNCGLPIAGPANRIVTSGFVTASLSPVMKDREELEQQNAEGKVCVADTTPAVRKYYNIELELCKVNTGLISMFNGWSQILGHDDKAIGITDKSEVEQDFGVAIEIWTGGRADEDCPTPTTDDIFSVGSSGRQYGYLLFGGGEFTLGDVEVGAQISNFTLSGITWAIPAWGRGPYNVAGTDAAGTPGRLLTPVDPDSHFTLFRTPVAPPEPTEGEEPEPLSIAALFVDPDFYFGGPNGEPAADIAPEQGPTKYTVEITGAPTGGTFTLEVGGVETGPIAFNPNAAAIETAINALPHIFGAKVTGTSTFTLELPGGGAVAKGDVSLTGGTTPDVTVTLVP